MRKPERDRSGFDVAEHDGENLAHRDVKFRKTSGAGRGVDSRAKRAIREAHVVRSDQPFHVMEKADGTLDRDEGRALGARVVGHRHFDRCRGVRGWRTTVNVSPSVGTRSLVRWTRSTLGLR